MTSPKPQALFDALERGEKILSRPNKDYSWGPWEGDRWYAHWEYEIIDPFAELKSAHKAGKVIQVLTDDGYEDCLPSWDRICHYRVKPEEPTLVPHWPAILEGKEGCLFIGTALFADEAAARKHYANLTVRLATEYPPIMLPEEEGK